MSNLVTLWCVADEENTDSAFPVKISMDDTVGYLKVLIKGATKDRSIEKFENMRAEQITLHAATIPTGVDPRQAVDQHRLFHPRQSIAQALAKAQLDKSDPNFLYIIVKPPLDFLRPKK